MSSSRLEAAKKNRKYLFEIPEANELDIEDYGNLYDCHINSLDNAEDFNELDYYCWVSGQQIEDMSEKHFIKNVGAPLELPKVLTNSNLSQNSDSEKSNISYSTQPHYH